MREAKHQPFAQDYLPLKPGHEKEARRMDLSHLEIGFFASFVVLSYKPLNSPTLLHMPYRVGVGQRTEEYGGAE